MIFINIIRKDFIIFFDYGQEKIHSLSQEKSVSFSIIWFEGALLAVGVCPSAPDVKTGIVP